MNSLERVIKVLQSGFITQKEIKSITKLSQATISRCLRKLGNNLLLLPNSSPKKYALPDVVFDTDVPFGLVEMDEHGKESFLGYVHAINGGKFFVRLNSTASRLYLGTKKNGLFDALPYFLDDLRPQGFLGNQIAEQLSKISQDYPKRLSSWSAKNIFQYLVEYGDDLPGNLIFGDGVFKSIKQPISPVSTNSYNFMCNQINEGIIDPGSSAGGEQQKFTVFNEELNSHVLVKFTSNENDSVTRRWKDILITEFHALQTLIEKNIPAAEVRMIDKDNRYYLETKRFDRLGNFGRCSMFSLQSIDMEFTGIGDNWNEISTELYKLGLISPNDDYYIYFLWYFSKLIGNTDTHLGNISFGIKGDSFSLLPIYDMCSMAMAPKLNQLKPISFNIPSINEFNLNVNYKDLIADAAISFWKRVIDDDRISSEFKNYLKYTNPIKKIKS